MMSSEGEVIILEDIIDTAAARGQVEKWLRELETDMKKSVKEQVEIKKKTISSYLLCAIKMICDMIFLQVICAKDAFLTKSRSQWALEWPGQTILCISKLYWTADITDKLPKEPENLKAYIEVCTHELNEIVTLVRGKLSTQNRTTLGWYSTKMHSVTVVQKLFSLFFFIYRSFSNIGCPQSRCVGAAM